ncbi:efflux RND transporter periplasmic adaptor subunit [Acidobacteria bacterium ACD]|nr:MAG: efflux RND transporter periplasmic adaptor subunit [Acidobacteriota bacterium]MCE7958078.1 efflux RND transporter periplasmic adaptor subunit [Acidobacteria bacterium ACB2]MDL1948603.1 efflux RND transporter periplasmic adaptor subunit [Acidobacteria bacterium ACD]
MNVPDRLPAWLKGPASAGAAAVERRLGFLPPGARRLLLVWVPVLVAALALAALLLPSRPEELAEVRVVRGELRVRVPLSGALSPARAESYGAEVPGVEMKVLELAEDGSRVTAGALLLRFDDAPFQRELGAARSRLAEARSEAEQARQALSALSASQASELSDARAALKRAELELSTFVNGAAPLAVQQSAAAVERARREAEDAKAKLDGLAPFAEKGYVSRDELRTAERRSQQADADLVLAEQQHATLVKYTHPQLMAQKTAEVESRREALASALKKGDAQVAQARAAWELSRARADEAARQEAEAVRRIASCRVVARSDGLVVHREIFEKGGERRKVRPGDGVFAGQPLLDLPDLSEMLVEGRVAEGEIHRLQPGQPAEVRLDAFPDRVFPARLLRIGALSSGEMVEARSFPVTLALGATDPRLRPGMSARALVDAGGVADALQVPVDAVRYEGSEPYVLVKTLGGQERREVKLGRSNAFHVEVQQGLSDDDVVLVGGR